jgi:hypothetical protein
MSLDIMLGSFLQNQKKYRIIIDGNGDYRVQYQIISGAMSGPATWHWEPGKYASAEEAERAIKEYWVEKVVKEL